MLRTILAGIFICCILIAVMIVSPESKNGQQKLRQSHSSLILSDDGSTSPPKSEKKSSPEGKSTSDSSSLVKRNEVPEASSSSSAPSSPSSTSTPAASSSSSSTPNPNPSPSPSPISANDYTLAPDETYPQLGVINDSVVDEADKIMKLPRARGGWEKRLNTPTYVGLHLGFWWIVDCWHHRVLYRKRQPEETDADLDKEKDFVNGWKKLKVANESWMVIPHSIASDGKSIIMIETSIGGSSDGTEHSILVFELLPKDHPIRTLRGAKKNSDAADFVKQMEFDVAGSLNVYTEADDFVLVQRLLACPPPRQEVRRPHRLVFDAGIRAFFLYITTPGALARFNLVFSSRTSSSTSQNANRVAFFDTPAQSKDDIIEDVIEDDRYSLVLSKAGRVRSSQKQVLEQKDLSSPGGGASFQRQQQQQKQIFKLKTTTVSKLEIEDADHLKKFGRIKPRVEFDYCKILPFMAGGYARSIALVALRRRNTGQIDHRMAITLGPNRIHRIAHRLITKQTPEPEIVPTDLYTTSQWKVKRGAMNDLFFHNNWWYITQTNKCAVYRQRMLPPVNQKVNFMRHRMTSEIKPQSIRVFFNLCKKTRFEGTDMCYGGGTPYFFSKIGKRLYLTYIFGCSGIYSFIPDYHIVGSDGNNNDAGETSKNSSTTFISENNNSSSNNPQQQQQQQFVTPVGDLKHHFDPLGWMETVDDLVKRTKVW